MRIYTYIVCTLLMLICTNGSVADQLPGTAPLTQQGDLAAQMVDGIDRYLMRSLEQAEVRRTSLWKPNTNSYVAYEAFLKPKRERLQHILGLRDRREKPHLEFLSGSNGVPSQPYIGIVKAGNRTVCRVYAVRWRVLEGVDAEGLLLLPAGKPKANVVVLPDCDMEPEQAAGLQPTASKIETIAPLLAQQGCRVLIPCLINRRPDFSGHPSVRWTNQPHREFIWRAAYQMGRSMIGYEVQKVLAAVDWFEAQPNGAEIGVVGYGEGGLIALYSGAIDPRLQVVGVSGYFQPRDGLWQEPIYRNLFGVLEEFGDAELGAMVMPRKLLIEHCPHPEVTTPRPAQQGMARTAAPGTLKTPSIDAVRREVARLKQLTIGLAHPPTFPNLQHHSIDLIEVDTPFSFSQKFLERMLPNVKPSAQRLNRVQVTGDIVDQKARQQRQFHQILEHTQKLMHESAYVRDQFWKQADAGSVEKWAASTKSYRDLFWEQIIGKLPPATVPMRPRSRLLYTTPKFKGYEVVLDVYDTVFAYGILLVPNDLKPGERRPVVVCQHGLEGRPQDVADPNKDHPAYHQFACKLTERGYITFSPQNPYIGEDRFRVLLRKAQPQGKTLFSFIVRQHERILDWLETLDFVDPKRIAFYGLSYGGKTAMRIPAVLERYALSICSADYNEWILKCASARSPYSYLFTIEYDMPEFDLGNTFNYAEMSGLICPRPFMVERGHHDGVAPNEWVAHEYARTFRRYDLLGIGNRTEIEYFNGPHTIHGVGTFRFLDKHLDWKPR